MKKKILHFVLSICLIAGTAAAPGMEGHVEAKETAQNDTLYETQEKGESVNAQDYQYIELSEDAIGITKYTGTAKNLEIPSEIDGKRVVSIEDSAFQMCNTLSKVSLPADVQFIGKYAFWKCENLETVEIQEGLLEIGDFAFEDCSRLHTIVFPESLEWISRFSFSGCSSLFVVRIPENTEIEWAAFASGCKVEVAAGSKGEQYAKDNGMEYRYANERFVDFDYQNGTGIVTEKIPCGSRAEEPDIPVREGYTFTGWYLNGKYYDFQKTVTEDIILAAGWKSNGNSGDSPKDDCSHTYTSQVTTTPTCTADGVRTYTCTKCKGSYTEKIPATGHTWKATVTTATTKKLGEILEKCTKCGEQRNMTVINKIKNIKLSKTSYTYNGKVQKPSVTIKDSKGKTLKNYTDYTAAYPKGMKNVGSYTVTIKFKGNYSGTVKKTFTIAPKGTSISKLSPRSGGFSVKWKKQTSQTTGYEIQYSTSSKFAKKATKTVTVSKNKTTSKTVSGLKAKKKYYVRIRTYKTVKVNGRSMKIYSGWSKVKSVK